MSRKEIQVLTLIDEVMKADSDYNNVAFAAEVVKELSLYFTEDRVIDVLDECNTQLEHWIDNYDPTPYEL